MTSVFYSARGPAILFVIYIGFFWKLTLTRQYTWLDSPDFAYQVMPWFQMEAKAFHQGTVPLWDPYEWGGQSLIGQMQPGVAYPLNWLLFVLPLNDGYIRQAYLHWYFVLVHYLGALFCFLLCRDLKLNLSASVLGGVAFGLSGWMGTTDWPQMLNGAVWAPLIFLFLLRTMYVAGTVRDASLAGAFLGLSLLSGHHQMPAFISLAVAGVWVYIWVLHARLGRWIEALRKTVLFALLAVLVSGLQVLPALEYGHLAIRWVSDSLALDWKTLVPYSVHSELSLSPSSLLRLVVPGVDLRTNPFMGWALLSLALLGLIACWRDRNVRIFGCLGLAGLLLALGRFSIYHGVLYALTPMMEKARSPAMSIFLFNFAGAVLAAYGTQSLVVSFAWLRRIYRLLYAAAMILGLAVIANLGDKDALALAALAALFAAAVLQSLRWQRLRLPTAQALLLLLALFELGNVSAANYRRTGQPDSLLKRLQEDRDLAAYFRGRHEAVRVELDRTAVPYNFGDWNSIDVFDGYTASMPVAVNRVAGEFWGRMLFALNYSVARKPIRAGQIEVFTAQSGLKVYENAEAFPRVWTVHRVTPISKAQILEKMSAVNAGMRSEVLLAGARPSLDNCTLNDQVTLTSRGLNRLTIDVDMQCKGMVVISEAFSPGWHAYVDGRSEKIWPAYTFLRGAVVPAGRHRIEMTYRPTSVIWGALMTAVGLLATVLLLRPGSVVPGTTAPQVV